MSTSNQPFLSTTVPSLPPSPPVHKNVGNGHFFGRRRRRRVVAVPTAKPCENSSSSSLLTPEPLTYKNWHLLFPAARKPNDNSRNLFSSSLPLDSRFHFQVQHIRRRLNLLASSFRYRALFSTLHIDHGSSFMCTLSTQWKKIYNQKYFFAIFLW